eukprot:3964584-Amphidinium_carterae.1
MPRKLSIWGSTLLASVQKTRRPLFNAVISAAEPKGISRIRRFCKVRACVNNIHKPHRQGW